GVDDAPAGAAAAFVAQQPDIDVVEREGQAHADPEHAGGHLEGGAALGKRFPEGIVELALEDIHRQLAFTLPLYVNVNCECKSRCLQPQPWRARREPRRIRRRASRSANWRASSA